MSKQRQEVEIAKTIMRLADKRGWDRAHLASALCWAAGDIICRTVTGGAQRAALDAAKAVLDRVGDFYQSIEGEDPTSTEHKQTGRSGLWSWLKGKE